MEAIDLKGGEEGGHVLKACEVFGRGAGNDGLVDFNSKDNVGRASVQRLTEQGFAWGTRQDQGSIEFEQAGVRVAPVGGGGEDP